MPGILIFVFAIIVGQLTYRDYGITLDEEVQRQTGLVNYDYIVGNSRELLTYKDRQYGVGFELPLIFLEKKLQLSDTRDIYLTRHWVTHIFFLLASLIAYFTMLRLFGRQVIACIGLVMLLFCPPVYAHSFFNSKDVPFLSIFLISLCFGELSFRKRNTLLFLLLGLICGYSSCFRILGLLPAAIFFAFLVIDVCNSNTSVERRQGILRGLLLVIGTVVAAYICTPYLLSSPVAHFTESFNRMAHFDLDIPVLMGGKYIHSNNPGWSYLPVWFFITVPELWLLAGAAGLLLVGYRFARSLKLFCDSGPRHFMLFLLCVVVPVLAAVGGHSALYDSWRHFYFIYPPFVFLALYFVNSLAGTRFYRYCIIGALLQIGQIGYFMIAAHPFQQAYFNFFVSHRAEALRKNYELDYWGSSYKRGLDYLLVHDPKDSIRIAADGHGLYNLANNLRALLPGDRCRFTISEPEKADYFLTNYRWHPEDYPYPLVKHRFLVLNSTVLCIYKLHE